MYNWFIFNTFQSRYWMVVRHHDQSTELYWYWLL